MQTELAVGAPWGDTIGDVERALAAEGLHVVIGADEVGRGPLAGPVTAAAVALRLDDVAWADGVDDSKRLREDARERWVPTIVARAIATAVVDIDVDEVDRLNILWASLEGMRRAVQQVAARVDPGARLRVVVDGDRAIPALMLPQTPCVRGDARSLAVAAASILAKVHRDAAMRALDATWPGYGFASHKGYGTARHLAALAALGPCPAHRRSFAPVRASLEPPREG